MEFRLFAAFVFWIVCEVQMVASAVSVPSKPGSAGAARVVLNDKEHKQNVAVINAIVALLNAVVTNKAKPAIKDASIIPSLQLQIHLANATMNKNDKKDLQEKFDVDLNKCIIDGEHKMPNFTSVANEMHQKFDSIREFDLDAIGMLINQTIADKLAEIKKLPAASIDCINSALEKATVRLGTLTAAPLALASAAATAPVATIVAAT